MRVVGDSGVVMDLADHVATGLLASGVVIRAEDAPEAAETATDRLIDLVEVQNEYLEILLRKHPALQDVAPDAFTGTLDPINPDDLNAIGIALGDLPEDEAGEEGSTETDEEDVPDEPQIEGLPAGNASRGAWEEFALANGKTEDDLMGQTRDAIRALFTSAPAAE